jgi:hypothetical protein
LEVRPDLQLPQELVNTVMMCLEKDPDRRPRTAAALIEYLERAEFGATLVSYQPGPRPTRGSGSIQSAVMKEMGDELFPRRSTGFDPVPSVAPAEDHLSRPASRPFLIGIVWLMGTVVIILGAVALTIWKLSPPQSARARSSPTDTQIQIPKLSSVSSPPTSAAANGSVSEEVGQPSLPNDLRTTTDARQPVVDPKDSADYPSRHIATSTAARVAPIPKPPGFSSALARARIDENEGRFEDALRQYELASAIDPSDASVKRHIALLRERISKEDDLIR